MANPINATVDYFRSSAAELKKVAWPSKDTTIRYSVTVITVCVALALFFGALDFGFSKLVTVTLSKVAATPAAAPTTPVTPNVQPTTETPSVDNNNASNPANNGAIQINPTESGPIQKK